MLSVLPKPAGPVDGAGSSTDEEILDLLAELHEAGRLNDRLEQDPSRQMLNTEPNTARFVNMLVRMARRRSVLEIGTSNGYTTIWLAWAAEATGGRVVSVDREARKHAQAHENLRLAGLRQYVDLLTGDAGDVVANLPGRFDCVFFDADRESAVEQLLLLLPKLSADALILADRVHSHPAEMEGYLNAVNALPDFDHVTMRVGKGLSIAQGREPGWPAALFATDIAA